MFLNHFQLTSQPFAERISAAALWQDDRMQQGRPGFATWPSKPPSPWSRVPVAWENPPC